MGRDIETTVFTRADRSRFREKVTAGLGVLRALVDRGAFETGRRTCGAEVEVAITGADGHAAARNGELLARLGPAGFETELARFTIEFGVQPQPVTGPVLRRLEADLCRAMDHAHRAAADLGAGVTMIGIL